MSDIKFDLFLAETTKPTPDPFDDPRVREEYEAYLEEFGDEEEWEEADDDRPIDDFLNDFLSGELEEVEE